MGWFGRILTFEVVAEEDAPMVSAILADASNGAIECTEMRTVGGYAAYGKSVAVAVEPLVSSFGVELFDDGYVVRGPLRATESILEDELGNSADSQPVARIQREQLPVSALPAALRLSHYDPTRDYQTGEARALASDQGGAEEQRELAAVMAAGDAKSLVQQMLAKSWAERDRLTLRLPPRRLALEPGAVIELALTPQRWTVTKCTVNGFVMVTELRPASGAAPAIAADGGRVAANSDVVAGEVTLALIDSAALSDSATDPTILVAASSPTSGWRAKAIEVRYGGQRIIAETARRKAVMGTTNNALPSADPTVIDTTSTLDVSLLDPDQWLVSCDDTALDEGTNLVMVGSEFLQFGQVDPIGAGQFRLSRLRRGLRDTEAAVDDHAAGETFVLIGLDALKSITLPPWAAGYEVSVVCGERSADIIIPGKPVPAAIADPSGGTTADSEARAAIGQMLTALRQQGLIAS